MEKMGTSLPRLTSSWRDSLDGETRQDVAVVTTLKGSSPPALAAERARLLFGCYRKGDANDPETYTAAIAAILTEYPPEVIRIATDPRTGIARKSKWMPNPAELAEECDLIAKRLWADEFLKGRGL